MRNIDFAFLILIIVFMAIALFSCVKAVEADAINPEPTATRIESLPVENIDKLVDVTIEKTGNIGMYDLFEYRSKDLICLIAKDCVGIGCSISLSCVRKE